LDELVRTFGSGDWKSKTALMKRKFPVATFGPTFCRLYGQDCGGRKTAALEQLLAHEDEHARFDALLQQGSEGIQGIEGIHFDKPPVHAGFSARNADFYLGKYGLPLKQLFTPLFFSAGGESAQSVRCIEDFRSPLHALDYKSCSSAETHFGNLSGNSNIVTFMDLVQVLTNDEDQLRFAMLYKPSLVELFASKISGGKIVGGIDDGAELVVDQTYGLDPLTGSLGMRTVAPQVTMAHYSRELPGRDLRATLLALKAAHGSATVVPISTMLELSGGATTILRLGGSMPERGASEGSVVPYVLTAIEAVQP
jgi:hypothetical protein